MTPAATAAAVRVARGAGLQPHDPVVLHQTNNTVVWLRPEAVVAKVATRPDARPGLRTEWSIASELVRLGADVAAPLSGAGPTVDEPTGFVVTLWDHVVGEQYGEVAPATVAQSLRRLHAALARTRTSVPSFLTHLELPRRALRDVAFPAALDAAERAFLRDALDEGLARLDTLDLAAQRLHGEPHHGNRLCTAGGIVWLDLESCCIGPVEWDLAIQPEGFEAAFPDVDADLLELLRTMNSARVATWCWGDPRIPEIRQLGELHLRLLHARIGTLR